MEFVTYSAETATIGKREPTDLTTPAADMLGPISRAPNLVVTCN